ncbi:hypothetical protein [Methylosinus sp. Sm6]|uniref:hypothetical protein n=1 Tax=Methylosinus sp. Sm6 TaxID=2866948 RepID=UPI001C99A013|nr:hypothetical protein [Methylosinus sp. Sm6]MBY6241631.1 hypothetical protein [Methylosinus sp. Sm6]
MWPLAGFAFGAVVGAIGIALGGKEMAEAARPGAKAVAKAAMVALHEARVRQAQLVEHAEDLFAEATAEVAEERTEAVAAAIRANAQKAAEARNDELVRRAEIVAAVRALYAETPGEPSSDRLAAAIAAAEERARAIVDAGRTAGGRSASAETIDLSAIKRTRAGGGENE